MPSVFDTNQLQIMTPGFPHLQVTTLWDVFTPAYFFILFIYLLGSACVCILKLLCLNGFVFLFTRMFCFTYPFQSVVTYVFHQ